MPRYRLTLHAIVEADDHEAAIDELSYGDYGVEEMEGDDGAERPAA